MKLCARVRGLPLALFDVVFGMPKAAAQLGAAAEVLPLARIASRLNNHFGLERAAVIKG